MRIIITLAILIFCVIRTISYAIYTIREKNITGGTALIILSALVIFLDFYVLFWV